MTLHTERNFSEPGSPSVKRPIKFLAVNGELENFYIFLKGEEQKRTKKKRRVWDHVGLAKPHSNDVASS